MIETEKEKICIHRLVSEKQEIIMCEGDMIVPDSKPDILNTICTSGVISIYKKEVLDGKVRIDGNINTYVMYLSEDTNGKIRSLNPSLDFSEIIAVPNCMENMNLQIDSNLKSIECKVINGRKISVKVAVEFNLKLYSDEEVEVINNILNQENIKLLRKETKVNSLLALKENKIYAKDTILIDNTDNLAEILKANISIVDKDIKLSYNKILAKSEAEFKIMYLTEDNQIKKINSKIPLIGFIDVQNITEENICDVDYQIQNIIIKPNTAEEHSIYIEIETLLSCMVYEEKNINLIQDLYSTSKKIDFSEKQINAITDKCIQKETKQIRENIDSLNMNNKRIIDVDVIATINKESKLNSAIMFEGNIGLNFTLISNDEQNLEIQTINIPFQHAFENLNDLDNRKNTVTLEIKSQDFTIQENGNVSCNIDMELNLNSYNNTKLNMIDEINDNGDREEQEYNVIIYITKNGDTLWKIAKKFGSTVEQIIQVNDIEEENKIYPNQKLFIPRYA